MIICYLGLGSNQKSPERQLRNAIYALRTLEFTAVTKVSHFYWTKAWGLHTQQNFCNAVIEIKTRLSPFQLLTACQNIEKTMGRVRKKHWGPRVIDIDILLYGYQCIHHKKNLLIPHPHLLSRDFVVLPLKEINPQALRNAEHLLQQ
ncbi:MAG: 2-amino-4-hydroxy-6-hydroxymethyldihydropteridine diphosphokinase [Legionella sp.]|uniref:2-amino-4-hydroxy-6- hydroxymethyldihydropteridine diphosphokinase n=1 Tax=Legionella sp. TaxID=459 RepID=UPI0039E33F87